MNREIAEGGTVVYLSPMSVPLPGRFWHALAGLAFLFAMVMPALASAHGQVAAMAPCAAMCAAGLCIKGSGGCAKQGGADGIAEADVPLALRILTPT